MTLSHDYLSGESNLFNACDTSKFIKSKDSLLFLRPPSASGNQTGSMAAALYARVAADRPAMGAAASLKSLVITPDGEPSVVVVGVSVVVVVVVVRKVVRNGRIGVSETVSVSPFIFSLTDSVSKLVGLTKSSRLSLGKDSIAMGENPSKLSIDCDLVADVIGAIVVASVVSACSCFTKLLVVDVIDDESHTWL